MVAWRKEIDDRAFLTCGAASCMGKNTRGGLEKILHALSHAFDDDTEFGATVIEHLSAHCFPYFGGDSCRARKSEILLRKVRVLFNLRNGNVFFVCLNTHRFVFSFLCVTILYKVDRYLLARKTLRSVFLMAFFPPCSVNSSSL